MPNVLPSWSNRTSKARCFPPSQRYWVQEVGVMCPRGYRGQLLSLGMMGMVQVSCSRYDQLKQDQTGEKTYCTTSTWCSSGAEPAPAPIGLMQCSSILIQPTLAHAVERRHFRSAREVRWKGNNKSGACNEYAMGRRRPCDADERVLVHNCCTVERFRSTTPPVARLRSLGIHCVASSSHKAVITSQYFQGVEKS